MQLLSKNEIIQNKNIEKKLQMDNGVKIAKKVDELRNTLSIEESKLATFRDKTVAEVTQEIAQLIDKKSSVASEILALEVVKDRMLLPVTLAEKRLQETKEKNEEILNDIISSRNEFTSLKRQTQSEINSNKSLIAQIEKREKKVSENEHALNIKEKVIEEKLFDIQQTKNNLETEYQTKLKILDNKIINAEYAEKHFNDFISNLKQKEKELDILLLRYGNNRSK